MILFIYLTWLFNNIQYPTILIELFSSIVNSIQHNNKYVEAIYIAFHLIS